MTTPLDAAIREAKQDAKGSGVHSKGPPRGPSTRQIEWICSCGMVNESDSQVEPPLIHPGHVWMERHPRG